MSLNYRKSSPALSLLRDLASKYTSLSSLLRSMKKKRGEVGKPGEIIEKLPSEEREKLKTLTSDEAAEMILSKGQADYICDEYWEKKSKEEQEKEYLSGFKLKK